MERQAGYILLSNDSDRPDKKSWPQYSKWQTPANSDMETTPLQEGGVLNISFLYYSFEIALYSYKNDCKHEFASYYLSISIPFWLIFEP